LGLQGGLVRIYRTLQRLEDLPGLPSARPGAPSYPAPFMERFIEMMDDDLNTGGALGLIFEKVREMNRVMDASNGTIDENTRISLESDRIQLLDAGRVLGLLNDTPSDFFAQLTEASPRIDPQEIEALIEKRAVARTQKDWAASDAIRDRLKEMGVVLEDGPKGTTWRLDV